QEAGDRGAEVALAPVRFADAKIHVRRRRRLRIHRLQRWAKALDCTVVLSRPHGLIALQELNVCVPAGGLLRPKISARDRRERNQPRVEVSSANYSILISITASRRFGDSPSSASFSNASSTSIPSTTCPNAEYCPSRFVAGPSITKKLVVAESGSSVRAIERIPRTCFTSLRTSPFSGCTHRSAGCPPPPSRVFAIPP